MHVYLARTSKEMHMKSDVIGLSNTKRLCRNAVLRQGDDVVLRWRTCHLITWWCGELTTSGLTQQSGLFTCIASDLGRAHQKYPCTVWGIIGLRHSPPQMKISMGSMRKKPYKEKNDLSTESSEVIRVVTLDTNNLSVRLWRGWRKESEKGLFLTIKLLC